MKSSDLMIDDWVLHNNKPKKVDVIWGKEVSLNDPTQVWGSIYTDKFNEDEIKPIPLTPEILEQNGFVKQDYDGWQISEDNGRGLIKYRTDYFDGFLIINYVKKPFSRISVKLKHVHELQHALRLCGINKEIEI